MAKAKKQKEITPEDIMAEIAAEVNEGLEEMAAETPDEAPDEVIETVAAESETPATAETTTEDEDASEEDLAITQEDVRLVEAILFASSSAVTIGMIAERFPEDRVKLIPDVLELLREQYASRGVTLVQRESRWALRTAADLGDQLRLEKEQPKKFTRAAMETMAVIAYHQPVTRAEIENIRGVATSGGTLDSLMEAGWIRPGKRREVPGRPVTWVTTQIFLDHFGLEKLEELPGMDELQAAGLLDKRPAIEAMPTADLFDGEDAEDINPNEVTDEDLMGRPDANDEVTPQEGGDIENEQDVRASNDEDDFDDDDQDEDDSGDDADADGDDDEYDDDEDEDEDEDDFDDEDEDDE